MLFTRPEFAIFLAAIMGALLLIRGNRPRKLLLLAASYYFYAWWDWRFCGLLLFSSAVDYLVGQGLKRTDRPGRRKLLLVVSLVCNLSVLGFFKYAGFFVDSLEALLSPLGLHLGTLHIILPVGISFYTFQSLSYTIDLYRREIPPCDDPADFLLYVSFFPQLVAGPIVRAKDFLPQLQTLPAMTWDRFHDGLRQILFGLVRKLLIADRVALFVDFVFANAEVFDSLTLWLAVIGYAVQIYCDFAGYSDIAIGAARMMGYDFPVNFDHPYISSSPREFWRRWHISLSTWLRDYLYIPLGGSRLGRWHTIRNLMLTMLLGGLWHGAAWRFVAWGGLHGSALSAQRLWEDRFGRRSDMGVTARRMVGWAATMLLVLAGWILFRAPTFTRAASMMADLVVPTGGVRWVHPMALIAPAFVILNETLSQTRLSRLAALPARSWHGPAVLMCLAWLVLLFAPRGWTPFLYFQF